MLTISLLRWSIWTEATASYRFGNIQITAAAAAVTTRLRLGTNICIVPQHNPINLAKQVVEEVRSHLPDKIFNTLIPRTVRLSEAPSFGKPIFAYDPDSLGAEAGATSAYLQVRAQNAPALRL